MFKKQILNLIPDFIYPPINNFYWWCREKISLLLYKGSTFHCPICNHSFSRFLSAGFKHSVLEEKKIIGGGFRENACCPSCGSLDRERLLFLFIQSNHLVQSKMRLLHIAPERNIQNFMLQKDIQYFSADLDSRLADMRIDIQQMPFSDNYFEAIICNHVLEHIPDDIKAMQELYRVLKQDGWAILQVPFSPILNQTFEDSTVTSKKEREKIFGQLDHVRIYGLDYPERLKSVGFTVTKEKMDEKDIQRFNLLNDEVIFFCKKPKVEA